VHWYGLTKAGPLIKLAMAETRKQAKEVSSIMERRIKTANSGNDLHFYVDPRLAGKYNINLHLMDENDRRGSGGERMTSQANSELSDFEEETVTFPSAKKDDSHYLATVVFQKPEKKVFSVSAYLLETYLGRYAYRADFYFREGSKASASRCYGRIVSAVRDLKQDVIEGGLNQNEIPYILRRKLQGEQGEIEPKKNKMAVYLDPSNVPAKKTIGTENMTVIPRRRPIENELLMDDQITRREPPKTPKKANRVWGHVAMALGLGDVEDDTPSQGI
jgi:hypothetical protein